MGSADAASNQCGRDERCGERSEGPQRERPPPRVMPRAPGHSARKAPRPPQGSGLPPHGTVVHPPGKSTSILSEALAVEDHVEDDVHEEGGGGLYPGSSSAAAAAPPRAREHQHQHQQPADARSGPERPPTPEWAAAAAAAELVPSRPQRPAERPPTPPWAQALRANAQERWSAFEARRAGRNAGFLAARFVSAAKPPSSPKPTATRPALAAAAALRSPLAVLPAARPTSETGPQRS